MDEEISNTPVSEAAVEPTVVEPRELTFEWYRPSSDIAHDGNGDSEIADTAQQTTATIIEPEAGKVLQESGNSILCWGQEFQGEHYVILKRDADYLAARTDVRLTPRETGQIELRGVTLEGEPPSPGWEIYVKTPEEAWLPVEGQHLQAHTESAEKWLEEIEKTILPKLVAQRTELIGQYHAITDSAPAGYQPAAKPLTYDAAFALTRNAIVGCNYDELHARAFTAEKGYNQVRTSLENHQATGKRHGLALYASWVGLPHYRKSQHLRRALKKSAKHYLKARGEVSELQKRIDASQLQQQIDEGARQLLAAQKLRCEAEHAGQKVAEAEKLVEYLHQNPRAIITLRQTRIQGRRTVSVPQPLSTEAPARKLRAAIKTRL